MSTTARAVGVSLAALAFLLTTSCNQPSRKTSDIARLPREAAGSDLLGEWVDPESGETVYRIHQLPDGEAVMEVPPNAMWRCEFKNIRYDDGRLLFDEYHYTLSSKDYQSTANPSGAHPFSGVRCETTLEVQGDNRDLAVHTIKTAHVPQGITGTLTRRRPVDAIPPSRAAGGAPNADRTGGGRE